MSRWVSHSLGQGVVLTRQSTALRDGELQSSSFVRMLPGNTEQLYPDFDYEHEPLGYGPEYSILDLHYMTFESGEEFLVVVAQRGFLSGGEVQDAKNGVYDIYDLNNPTTTNGTRVPNFRFDLQFRPDNSTLINRGAEYFFGVTGLGGSSLSTKRGDQRIFYIEDGSFKTRGAGALPARIGVSAEKQYPTLNEDLFQLPNIGSPWSAIDSVYNWSTCLERDLFGSIDAFEAEYSTIVERDEVRDLFRDVAPAVDTGRLMSRFIPVTKVRLAVPGNGFTFAYWVTEYDADFDVESAPSDISTSTNADMANAEWEVTLNWQAIVDELGETGDDIPQNTAAREFVFWSSAGRQQRIDDLFEVRDQIQRGSFPAKQVIRVPISKAQREEAKNIVTISGQFKNPQADTARLYRQNLGAVADFLVEYKAGDAGAPTAPEIEGEGSRNAIDLREGRIQRQGGLLEEFERAEIPVDYDDIISNSGVADPGFAYPVVNYTQRGGLGVFQYLRRPENFSVGTNMGQSLLRVPHTEDIPPNLIFVSPSEAPEQQPLIYSIPVVTEQQDEVKALETLRDQAVVITRGSAFRLNYIPFEGSNQADRVLAQISTRHGTRSQRRSLTVNTPRGQIVVFLSASGLMGTNGTGLFDVCPDFSVEAAERQGYTFEKVVLTDNPNLHRLEMWADGVRWDFYYHESQLKDIRGDGYGLVFKLMGPTRWYEEGTVVPAACTAVRPSEALTYHILRGPAGGHMLATSSAEAVDDLNRRSSVVTRKFWGSDPRSRLRVKWAEVQHQEDLNTLVIGTIASPADEVGGTDRDEKIKLDRVRLSSGSSVRDGLGSALTFEIEWSGGPIGPFWTQVEEARSATGR